MRVVVDTNVFVSAALKDRSPPSNAVHLAAERDLILKSSTTEQELLITLARPRLAPLIPERFLVWLEEVLTSAELVPITEQIVACRDPKDDKFLELAVSGHADLIISGDVDLLTLNPFRGIPIITPAFYAQGAEQ
ncbi:MAG TPA: putative toxin-antitoxin system toxin component, PIN family [Stellaceae bacterium]|jgi:putative PIN family toxin of toxin-antitoxin system